MSAHWVLSGSRSVPSGCDLARRSIERFTPLKFLRRRSCLQRGGYPLY